MLCEINLTLSALNVFILIAALFLTVFYIKKRWTTILKQGGMGKSEDLPFFFSIRTPDSTFYYQLIKEAYS